MLTGDNPTQFAVNTITPIYKGKGEPSSLDSYRGIAVGSLFGKVYEHVLHSRLNKQAEQLGLRGEAQYGFRPGRGSLDGMFVLRHLVERAQADRRPMYCVFVDFEKAFDCVDRALLLQRWRAMGVSGSFHNALVNMYDRVCMRVKAGGLLGPAFDTTCGTKQGSLLSPLLFGGFVEILGALIAVKCPSLGPVVGTMRVPILLYADDIVLITEQPCHTQQATA